MYIDPVTLFREGGPFMYAILGLVSVLQVAAVVLFGSLVARVRMPAAIWVALSTLPLFAGLLGTYMGFEMALQAVASASPEYLSRLASAGMAVGLYTTIAGAYASVFLLLSFGFATGLGLVIRPGKEARLTTANALIAGLVLLLGSLLGVFFSGPGAAFVVFATGVSWSLAALRFSDEEDRDKARVGAGRAAVGLYGVLALVFLSVGSAALSYSLAYNAQARASAEMEEALVRRAMDGLTTSQLGIAGLAVLLLVATPFVVGPGMRAIGARAIATGVFSVVLLLPLVGMGALTAWKAWVLADFARPIPVKRAEVLGSLGLSVPSVDSDLTTPLLGAHFVTFGPSGVLIDGAPGKPAGVAGRDAVVVEAPGSLPLTELAPWAGAVQDRGFCLTVDARGLACLPVQSYGGEAVAPEPDPEPDRFDEIERERPMVALARPRIRVKHTPDGWSWFFGSLGEDGEQASGAGLSIAALESELERLRVEFPDEEQVGVWFEDDATVDDYVAFVEGVSTREGTAYDTRVVPGIVWRLDAIEPFPEPMNDLDDMDPSKAFAVIGKRLVRRDDEGFRTCFQRELAQEPDLTAEIDVQISVGPDGSVISARVLSSSVSSRTIETCVVNRFRRLDFPETPSGTVEVLRLPYVLNRD